LVNT